MDGKYDDEEDSSYLSISPLSTHSQERRPSPRRQKPSRRSHSRISIPPIVRDPRISRLPGAAGFAKRDDADMLRRLDTTSELMRKKRAKYYNSKKPKNRKNKDEINLSGKDKKRDDELREKRDEIVKGKRSYRKPTEDEQREKIREDYMKRLELTERYKQERQQFAEARRRDRQMMAELRLERLLRQDEEASTQFRRTGILGIRPLTREIREAKWDLEDSLHISKEDLEAFDKYVAAHPHLYPEYHWYGGINPYQFKDPYQLSFKSTKRSVRKRSMPQLKRSVRKRSTPKKAMKRSVRKRCTEQTMKRSMRRKA